MILVSLTKAKLRGRFDTDALDADIELAIGGASKIILTYLGDSVDGWYDSSGDPILDTDGVVFDVPADVENATIFLALWFIRNPGRDPDKEWEMGYFPGAAMLYQRRTPTVA